jgi:hypothetical protein
MTILAAEPLAAGSGCWRLDHGYMAAYDARENERAARRWRMLRKQGNAPGLQFGTEPDDLRATFLSVEPHGDTTESAIRAAREPETDHVQ